MVAEFLAGHPLVAWVSYPGLPGSPHHALARRYMPRGTGAVFTFGVKGGYQMGIKVVEGCELLSHLANIGDTRSLIIHPASTTHRQLDEEQLRKAGAGPEVVRISIGLETAADYAWERSIDRLERFFTEVAATAPQRSAAPRG